MEYTWRRQTVAETMDRIARRPEAPWVALGDFLDDWKRSDVSDRLDLVADSPTDLAVTGAGPELLRWQSLCGATVEWLCRQDGLPAPPWTVHIAPPLDFPWFLYPGDALRPWQLATTPAPFKMRNIFGGDRILDRV